MTRSMPLVLLSLASLSLGALLFRDAGAIATEVRPAERILVGELRGPITPVTVEYVGMTLERAAEGGYGLLVFEMDTPGGLVVSTEAIIQKVLGARVPVVVLVTPAGAQAASAGLYIANAADIIAMAPGTRIGAGHPVSIGPGADNKKEESSRDLMGEKVENDLAASVRSIATQRKRNAAVYERMVRESISLTEREAKDQNVVDLIAADVPRLLESLEGLAITRFDGSHVRLAIAGAPIDHARMTLRQRILSFVANPNYSFILLALAAIGIYTEFNHPGLILPGAIGAIALVLFAMSMQILPMNVLGLMLIILALALFVLEIKFTSYGLLTLAGVVALTVGFLTLFDTEEMPGMRISLAFLLPTSITIAVIMGVVTLLVVKAQRAPIVTGVEGLLGEVGEAMNDIGIMEGSGGRVFVHGESWSAVALCRLSKGTRVRVRRVHHMTLEVEPLDQPRESSPTG